MRVIAGSARRIQLKTVKGMETRPTTDRIKETLFNMIQPVLCDASFLDLFSGSGGIGIEALSRGAAKASFVENDREAAGCIKANLKATKLTDKAAIYNNDVFSVFKIMEEKKETFDIIFMDPPYNQYYEKKVLDCLNNSSLVHKDTMIIVEASIDTEFNYIEDSDYEIFKIKNYKTNKHVFIHKKTGKEEQ